LANFWPKQKCHPKSSLKTGSNEQKPSHATVPLKGVWHKIFDFSFSHESVSPGSRVSYTGFIKTLENCAFTAYGL
jgi:hypothetical protein